MRDLFSPYMYVRTYVYTCPSRFRNVNQQRFRNATENAKTFSTYLVHPVYGKQQRGRVTELQEKQKSSKESSEESILDD